MINRKFCIQELPGLRNYAVHFNRINTIAMGKFYESIQPACQAFIEKLKAP